MSPSGNSRPKPGNLLYGNLFESRSPDESIQLLSEGITACLTNARRLLGDATVLGKEGRNLGAAFLLATTDEEIAKCYILLDMGRLDGECHDARMRRLCRAFYSHIDKHAYNRMVRGKWNDMATIKRMWEFETTRWFPGSYEDGEPDMPDETFFTRELPLYADFSDYNKQWFVPERPLGKFLYGTDLEYSTWKEAESQLSLFDDALSTGLLGSDALGVLHGVFSPHFISEKTQTDFIADRYDCLFDRLESELGIARASSEPSPLYQWPLYAFV